MQMNKLQNGRSSDISVEIITSEEFQIEQADRIEERVFGKADNGEKTADLIRSFVASYEQQKKTLSLEIWLSTELRKHSDSLTDPQESERIAHDIISRISAAGQAKESLYAHLDSGKSKESWLGNRIEAGAKAAGVQSIGAFAEAIDQDILEANVKSLDAIYNRGEDIVGDWEVSYNPHMHGFIAEVDVANQFNLNAAAGKSSLRADVLGSTAKNSPDLVIRDSAGKVIQEIQIKSYANVDQAINNIRSHQYPGGTTLLVHEDQVERLQREFPNLKVTSRLDAGGVSADMHSHTEYKRRQEAAQIREEAKQYEWNDLNKINVVKGIAKQTLIAAGISAGMQGARIVGRRLWNKINGKESPPASEDLKEFFESSIKTGTHVGIQVAISGAMVVAVKNGWLGNALKNTPAGKIANAVYVGMENAKIIYKFAKGEIGGVEALDAMGNVTCSAVGGLLGAEIGMAQGALLGTPLGLVGIAVGGVVGGIIGGMAGSKIGEAVYAGGQVITKTAVNVVRTLWEGTKDVLTIAGRVLNPLNWFA
jgi:hypothetical protein